MKILLVDDHALFREGVKLILNRLNQTLEVLEANDYHDALQSLNDNADLDLILTDLIMPGMPGMTGLCQLREQAPSIPIIVLSASESPQDISQSLECGANGYIPKTSSNELMLNAVRFVLSGGVYLPPVVLDNSPSMLNSPIEKKRYEESSHLKDLNLTQRQFEVLRLMVKGDTNKAIGGSLNISETTVKTHITTILQSLGVNNRTQAVSHALRMGLVAE